VSSLYPRLKDPPYFIMSSQCCSVDCSKEVIDAVQARALGFSDSITVQDLDEARHYGDITEDEFNDIIDNIHCEDLMVFLSTLPGALPVVTIFLLMVSCVFRHQYGCLLFLMLGIIVVVCTYVWKMIKTKQKMRRVCQKLADIKLIEKMEEL